MTETGIREGNLPPRPLAVRGGADAGLRRQYQRKTRRRLAWWTPTNASLGSLDPARLSRLDAQGRLVSGDAPTKEVPLHTALYQTRGAARAVVHLHSTHSVALSIAARDRFARRAAADDGVLPDEVRRDRAGAVLSAGDSGRRRCDQGSRRKVFIRAARQSRPGGIGGIAGGGGIRDRGAWKKPQSSIYCCAGSIHATSRRRRWRNLSKTFGLTLPEHGHD